MIQIKSATLRKTVMIVTKLYKVKISGKSFKESFQAYSRHITAIGTGKLDVPLTIMS